jgi:sugar O-acyltransferase (sialic acid O-acetyltransferase NeuD family)
VVFGAGGHARAVVDVLERCGEKVVAVVGDTGRSSWHVDVLPDDETGLERVAAEGLRAVVAIGAASARMAALGRIAGLERSTESTAQSTGEASRSTGNAARSMGGTVAAPPVIAATATVARDAELGPGTVVLEHAHVGPASRVGAGVIVNTSAVVEHDCTIGDGVHVAPGAIVLGGASVGARTLIGSGARVLPQVVVGADVTIGAGAVVAAPVQDGRTVVGVPARVVGSATGGEEPS